VIGVRGKDLLIMTLKEKILAEHSKEHALAIAEEACSSAKQFKALMECYLADDYRLSQRAAWSVSWAARKKPAMIQPYIHVLVRRMQEPNVHPAVIRNAVRILQEIDIPEIFHGDVMHACFSFIENYATPAAIKAFSLTILAKLTKTYPAILGELKLIIEERWENETPAFKSRAKQILAL
jgi:dihydroorotase